MAPNEVIATKSFKTIHLIKILWKKKEKNKTEEQRRSAKNCEELAYQTSRRLLDSSKEPLT